MFFLKKTEFQIKNQKPVFKIDLVQEQFNCQFVLDLDLLKKSLSTKNMSL